MKKNLKKGISLIRYGAAFKLNLVLFIIMFVLGIAFEVLGFRAVGTKMSLNSGFMGIDLGAVFLLCTAAFPGQMTLSVDLSALAQTSPHKKNIQTSMVTKMNLVFSLIAMTLVVVIRLIMCAVTHTGITEGLGNLWYSVGILEFVLLLFFAVCYKYFIATMVVMYLVLMAVGWGLGFAVGSGVISAMTLILHPVASLLVSYAFLILGAVLGNGISRLLYQKNLSKFAFGISMQRTK